jgi:hypothetical protein
VLGSFFAFKFYQIWRLTATGTPSQPFRADAISKNVGAITQRAIVVGEDENGDPCLYFMSHRGPYRWGTNGLDYIGKGVEDLILGPTSTIYVTGQDNRLAHCIYHRDKRQVWFWVTTASGAFTGSRACLIYHIPTNSWSRFLGNDSGTFPNSIEKQGASMMFANTVGSVMSMDNKPYGSYVGGAGAKIIKWDDSTSTTDVGDQFQGYVRTRAYEVGGPSQDAEVTDAQLVGVGSSQINVLTVPDFGASPSKGGTAFSFAPVGSEPRVIRRAEDTTLSGAQFYQWLVGDYPSPSVATWNIDRLVVGTKSHESLI